MDACLFISSLGKNPSLEPKQKQKAKLNNVTEYWNIREGDLGVYGIAV